MGQFIYFLYYLVRYIDQFVLFFFRLKLTIFLFEMNSSMSEQYYRNGKAIFVLLTISHWNFNALIFAMGDPGTCLDKNGEGPFMFEVLPGYGWDNLMNENRGAVVHFNYLKCKTTEDRRYLIPDELVTFPIKASQLHVVSNVFDHWSKIFLFFYYLLG